MSELDLDLQVSCSAGQLEFFFENYDTGNKLAACEGDNRLKASKNFELKTTLIAGTKIFSIFPASTEEQML